jgi:inorganic triphosphatase YgiF
MEATLESELKYTAETDAPLQILARQTSLGPAALGPPRAVEEVDRYADTADGRLSLARWACRVRTRGEHTIVSLKGPGEHSPGAAIHRRQELEGPAAPDLDPFGWPPSPARELLLELIGDETLVERLTLVQRRTERAVMLGDLRAGLLSLDRARVLHHSRELGVMFVVELELDPAALVTGMDPGPLERALAAVTGLRPDPSSKLERALELIRGAPA